MGEQHNDKVRQQFTEQASTFSSLRTISTPANIQWILDNLPLMPQLDVLDVAAGTGAQSRAMAPYVRQVTAIDMTPAMLLQAQRETQGIANIRFEQGLAEHLPHADHAFDLAVIRFAIHHMLHHKEPMLEMARVIRPGGYLALIDLISPDDLNQADQYNHFERLRDPSHAAALSRDGLLALVREVGLEVTHVASRPTEANLTNWLDQTKPALETRTMIVHSLKAELNGGDATGMQPFMKDGEIMFIHTWCVVVGKKIIG